MDDQMDERMDDEIDGWNDVSRHPLLYVILSRQVNAHCLRSYVWWCPKQVKSKVSGLLCLVMPKAGEGHGPMLQTEWFTLAFEH